MQQLSLDELVPDPAAPPAATPAALQPDRLRELLQVPFTDEQLRAATAPLGPGVVVAGAGSGKTAVMAARVVWLVLTGQVLQSQVLGLTFTTKAAGELAQRIRSSLATAGLVGAGGGRSEARVDLADGPWDDPAEELPTVATYHAYAGRLLRDHGVRLGVEPDARLLTEAQRFQLADRVLRRAPGPFPAFETGVARLVGSLVALEAELNEHLVDPAAVRAADAAVREAVRQAPRSTARLRAVAATADRRDQLLSVVELLRRAKVDRSVLDFGDQVALAVQLVRDHPAVVRAERERFRVVLLDEYQDTSVAQKELLLRLFGDGHAVTAVGDPCQAIYGWRGASVRNIGRFRHEFRRNDGTEAALYPLSQNNRSGGRLLEAANVLAAPLRVRHPEVQQLRPRPGQADAGRLELGLFPGFADEVEAVADRVTRLVHDGEARAGQVAVLVRVRSDIGPYHAALTGRGLPVEVVGLGGLLALPEVVDLVATLEVLDDPTANAALVRLLAGPRWRIGPRDLVLLGRRAAALVGGAGTRGGADGGADAGADDAVPSVEELLEAAVAGTDPADVVSLSDALDTFEPAARRGLPLLRSQDRPSDEAVRRFRQLAGELAELRRHLDEPLVDLVHRVVATTGLDVEVAARGESHGGSALAAFVRYAADFADVDATVPSVRSFLAYLRAADEHERGLETAAPTPSDSVKLLTVHKAKGLEWDVVVLPDLTDDVFPARQGRPRWTERAEVLPTWLRGDAADFPAVEEWSNRGLDGFADAMRQLDDLEETRLGYVAVTRPRRLLWASSHWWGPTQKRVRGPSPFLELLRDHVVAHPAAGQVVAWADPPEQDVNPALADPLASARPWPPPLEPHAFARRRAVADAVAETAARGVLPAPVDDLVLAGPESDRVAGWDRDAALLLAEARRAHTVDLTVPLPGALSASALVRLARDPDGLAADLARPLPRPPAPAAARGTRFHAWVEEQFGLRPLLDRDELAGAADDDLVLDTDLAALQRAFLAGPYATRPPLRLETPFQLVLGGRVVRGRIDAVYAVGDDDPGATDGVRYEVVDWKTGAGEPDPLQLAIYRAAWALVTGVPEHRVRAVFYLVATGEVRDPGPLPGRDELERLLADSTEEPQESNPTVISP